MTNGPAAVEHLQAVYGRLPDPVARAQIAVGLGHMLLFTDREREAAALLRAAREELPADRADLRGLLHALELTTVYLGNADPALRRALREEPRSPRSRSPSPTAHGSPPPRSTAATARCPPSAARPRPSPRSRRGELIEVYQGGTVPIAPMMTLIWADREEGLAQLDALQAEAHRSGSLFGANGLGMWRSHALHARGDLAGAEEEARRTVENTRMWGFGDAGSLTFLDAILATILVARGDVEGARAALGGPWDDARARGRAVLAHGAARGARRRGRGRGGRRRGGGDRRASTPRSRTPRPRRGARWSRPRSPGSAGARRRWRSPARRSSSPGAGARRARSAARCGCSACSSSTTTPPRASPGWRRPSPCSTRRPPGWSSPARSPRRAPRCAGSAGPADAREPLRRALELAVACSATGLAEHVRTELYAAGARPRTDARSGAAALTASERRVADLAAGGETNRDIAQTLYVTPKTVEVHLSNAYRKLGIRSRRELAGALAA